jgi:hypothetical protein
MRDPGPRRPPQSTLRRLLVALTIGWLAAVLAIQLSGPALTPADVASSPDSLAAGQLVRLLSSSLIIDDDLPLAQFALLAAVTAVVLVRHGAIVWWLAALVGHIGSALIAYAIIALAVALGSGLAERFTDTRDYGISCVLAAELGVLFMSGMPRRGGRRGTRGRRGSRFDAVLAVASVSLLVWLVEPDWFGLEHSIAFAIGAAVLVGWERAQTRPGPVGRRARARPRPDR